jgi:phage baseplate assembly protein W
MDAVVTQITQWEPRAQLAIQSASSQFDAALVNADVNVSLITNPSAT